MLRGFNLRKPFRFRARGRVEVFRKGVPFYVRERRGAWSFTLPAGSFTVHGDVSPDGPHREPFPDFSRPLHRLPERLRIRWGFNPNKCSIDLAGGVILCDRSFQEEPEYVKRFIFLHELGHYFHETEEACDHFAARCMKALGFNPSQIWAASDRTLADGHRRACNLETSRQFSANE